MSLSNTAIAIFFSIASMVGSLFGCTSDGSLPQSDASSQDLPSQDLQIESYEDYAFKGYDTEKVCDICFSEDGVSVVGEGVKVDGNDIVITKKGSYLIHGKSDNGSIEVDVESGKVNLILDGVTLSKSNAPSLNVVNAKKVTLSLLENTQNSFSSTGGFVYKDGADEPDATIFSKDDIVINGSGSLEVSSDSVSGIKSKDSLVIAEGNIKVTAQNNGIVGKDFVSIYSGSIYVDAKNNGIKSTNTQDASLGYINVFGGDITICSGDNAIVAQTQVCVFDGNIDIVANGGHGNAPKKSQPAFGGANRGNKSNTGRLPQNENPNPNGNTGRLPFGENPNPDRSTGKVPPNRQDDFAAMMPFDFDSASSQGDSNANISAEDTTKGKGINGRGSIVINGGSIKADCANDALHSNGFIEINGGVLCLYSGDDGVHSDKSLTINGGTIDIPACYEGLESEKVNILGGDINIVASDDGINAALASENDVSLNDVSLNERTQANQRGMMSRGDEECEINIHGGRIVINAGADGLDSNGVISVYGGEIYISCMPRGGDGSIDCDISMSVSGGTVFVVGGMTSDSGAVTLSNGVVCLNLSFNETIKKDTVIEISSPESVSVISSAFSIDANSFTVFSDKLTEGVAYEATGDSAVTSATATGEYKSSGNRFGGFRF